MNLKESLCASTIVSQRKIVGKVHDFAAAILWIISGAKGIICPAPILPLISDLVDQ